MPATAFEELVAEHQRSVLRVCRSILRDDHLGADAAQETFLRLWRQLRTEGAPARLAAWLRRAAVTTSLDALRRRRRGTRALEVELPPDDAVDPAAPSPAGRLASRELFERFERALDRLSPGQRTVFLLKHSGGLSLAEVAETLGVSVPTAKTQFARACLALQRALRSYRPEIDDER